MDASFESQLANLLQAGQKLDAIKLIREKEGLELKAAQERYDQLDRR